MNNLKKQDIYILPGDTNWERVNMQDRIVHSTNTGTSLVVQWLRLHTSTSGGVGLIPDQGSMTPHATQCGQTKIKKNNNNKQVSTEQPYRQGVKVNMKMGQGTGLLLMIFFSTQQIKIFLNYQGTRYEVIKKIRIKWLNR